ncbi:MAG: SDR family NAD(P)-dependent oxidoreductase [Woeseia sp.]|nr:SDR family NAD(P)-dependent oxidoreductase [Woeseia sp.]MBT8097492.1 SDR family NAD(P)-dependent oxidoreductase [Woeseia sp.]NNL54222.1 SDR family NAD(P)-dependent oxidoreductase [Woeseia sp.]
MENNEAFAGKTVIITGGSEGVGAATARRFARAGANLLLVARRKKNLEVIADELRAVTKVSVMAVDVSDEGAVTSILKKAAFDFEKIHFLVNNAGLHARGPVATVAPEELARMVDVNLKAPILLSRLAIPYIQEAGGGAIINVASLAGRTPVPNAATYSATKFGLRAFTFALAEELSDGKIKIAAVSPGPIDTGFIMENIDNVADITFSQPLSTADEVAEEIVKLCLNDKRERSMPPISGLLTTLSYLFPQLGRALQPMLIRRGRRVKREWRAKMRAAEKDE